MNPIDWQQLYDDGRHYDLQNSGIVDDIPFYLRQAEKYGEPVLELACGMGRITIPIADQGIQITGLDLSEPMLSQPGKKAAMKGVNVTIRLCSGMLDSRHARRTVDSCWSLDGESIAY